MSGYPHRKDDMADHPDAFEMRGRYARVLGAHDVALVNGPVFLVGLFYAASPWILHFAARSGDLAVHALIVGGAVCLLALGFTVAPERMTSMSGALVVIGFWTGASPWVVGRHPGRPAVLDGTICGALALALGVVSLAMVRRANRLL
ncbi:membrane protein [Streptomyces hygroscopicus subsp. hygroscopicus]|uniref:SPW repeat protein n=1 Tax=Streptomyces sp. KHY 26 TaxID=3097359 RepID=UPI0024A38D5C|nr:SPW repeat protein [Streptomyces hygroscopicus]GLX49146.1 membrane protein [Streptomyces hygroscopicus subsp. hygroscopicus]